MPKLVDLLPIFSKLLALVRITGGWMLLDFLSNDEVLVVAMAVAWNLGGGNLSRMQVNKKGVDHDRSDPLGWYGIRWGSEDLGVPRMPGLPVAEVGNA